MVMYIIERKMENGRMIIRPTLSFSHSLSLYTLMKFISLFAPRAFSPPIAMERVYIANARFSAGVGR